MGNLAKQYKMHLVLATDYFSLRAIHAKLQINNRKIRNEVTKLNTIQNYWKTYVSTHPSVQEEVPDAWMFGNGSEKMGNELGKLVVEGIKTATCSAHFLFEMEKEPLPKIGQYDIVLSGNHQPLAIIQTTSVEIVPMNNVSKDFAYAEGEGNRSYDYWYQEHKLFFTELLKEYGRAFTPDILLVCQQFKVVDVWMED